MSLQLLPSIIPPEVRSLIFVHLDNKNLAKDYPEVFWALAPEYFRVLSLGKNFNFHKETTQTELAGIYPASGAYVEKLTLITDPTSVTIISEFLINFPLHRKLKHLSLQYSPLRGSFWSAASLPYLGLLEGLLASSPTLTRLSFSKLQPCSSLITSAPALTRLDLGHWHYNPLNTYHTISLPSQLEILSLTPTMVEYISDPPPPTLRIVIVHAEDNAGPDIIGELQAFISNSPSVTSLALVDIYPTFSLLIPFLLDQLTPRVANICFKFTRQDGQSIRRLKDSLLQYEITFRFCTVLLPFYLFNRDRLHDQVVELANTFSFDACLFHSPNVQITYGTVVEAYQNLVDEWVDVVD